MKINPVDEYKRWQENVVDEWNKSNLISMENDEDEIADSFYQELSFGTSGIRGIIGTGTNRINKYVVKRATLGIGEYLIGNIKEPSVVIAYDNRLFSKEFAREVAEILSGMKIKTYLFDKLTPVPVLSYAVEYLKTDLGIMITASHNAKIFNGYKVYNRNGGQITGREVDEIWTYIKKRDYFEAEIKDDDNIYMLDNEIGELFLKTIKEQIPVSISENMAENLKIVYTPLNGTGGYYVNKILKDFGLKNIYTVESQAMPNPDFPTCPVPNPEKISAYQEAFKVFDDVKADIIIATDPDSDRFGLAIQYEDAKINLSGNQIGILLLEFMCEMCAKKQSRKELKGKVIRSFVSSPIIDRIAKSYGLEPLITPTGFKHIGKSIADMEKSGKHDEYFFGYEESNGFLVMPFIKDKDGISTSLAVSIMTAYYKSMGISLKEKLEMIYEKYGHCIDKTKNFTFKGRAGKDKMEDIMNSLRGAKVKKIGKAQIKGIYDYMCDNGSFPKSNTLRIEFQDGSLAFIRPSGTEPKIKLYLFLNSINTSVEEAVSDYIKEFH